MRTIELNDPFCLKGGIRVQCGIRVQFDPDNPEVGDITGGPDLYQTCPSCGRRDCVYQCEGSVYSSSESPGEDEKSVAYRLKNNGAVEGILAVILGHAISGIDIENPDYLQGLGTAFYMPDGCVL